MNAYERLYPEYGAGGFTRYAGTVQFFGRINALVEPEMSILDFGAGRGLLSEHRLPYIRGITNFKNRVRRVTGIDIDPVVTTNPTLDEGLIFDGIQIPADDEAFDLIYSDHVFEHIADPALISAELYRVLKPGGWLCARTPHLYSTLVVGSKLIPNSKHANVLTKVQPGGRAAHDVFPTFYRLNSMRALRRHFPKNKWSNHSYTWNPEPGYNFNSVILTRILSIINYVKKPLMGGEVMLVFAQKKS
ncbi:MAG: class I SAM-dependent methyltransferase [Candidatus Andeanibacterium colombiense]|uniref:Class I SAM-dependent methyltransferase n=1 Tax=Candidatus Andeanibacterium colombiense TaxID=3121345 RepID=A0AAJ6BNY5_9SPHN|nr:MAG: class I SAM-dependent methyltransferase [Sphingomonadaceae bacterium]